MNTKLKEKVLSCFKQDWLQQLVCFWNKIDPLYKKSFLWIFLILNGMFLFYTMNFMIGNHSWDLMQVGSSFGSQLWRGGFFQTFADQIFWGQYLPVLYSCHIFLAMAVSVILLAHYWNIPKTTKHYITFGVFMATMPYILAWLYYYGSMIFWSPVLAIFALRLSHRSTKIKYYLFSIVLLLLCFGSYPVILNTILVVFLGRCFLKCVFENRPLKTILFEGFVLSTQILVAGVIVKGIHFWLKAKGWMWKHTEYSGMMTPLNEMGSKIIECIQFSFSQFFYSFPFIPLSYKIVLFALTISALFLVVMYAVKQTKSSESNIKVKLIIGIGILLMALFATKTIALLSPVPNAGTAPRFDFYGLRFFYALMVAVLMLIGVKSLWSRNILLLLMVILLPMHLYFNLLAQKVWKFGFDAEMKLVDRIVNRIEMHPDFEPLKPYAILNVGSIPSMRKKYYPENSIDLKEDTLLNYSFYPPWKSQYNPIAFYYSYNNVFESMDAINGYHICTQTQQATLFVADRLFDPNLKPWPDKSSVFIKDFVIVVVHSQAALDHLRKMILAHQMSNK